MGPGIRVNSHNNKLRIGSYLILRVQIIWVKKGIINLKLSCKKWHMIQLELIRRINNKHYLQDKRKLAKVQEPQLEA